MDISAIIKAVLAAHDERTGNSMVELKPGDLLAGKVLKVESDGRVLIDLGGRRALARIGFPVKSGQNLKLQVVDTGSILHLRADTPQSGTKAALSLPTADFSQAVNTKDQAPFIQIAERLMAGSQRFGVIHTVPKAIQNAWVQIKAVFETIPMERSTEQITQWLKTAVEDRGVLFEKRMADMETDISQSRNKGGERDLNNLPARILITRDVKSQLIQLKGYLSQAIEKELVFEKVNSKEIAFLHRSVDRMLGHIEQQQGRAVARWGDGENQQVIVHSLPLPDQNKPIQLKIYYPGNDDPKRGARQHQIALLLNMDQLGDVRVDLSMMDRQLQIGFFVEDTKIQQLMAQHARKVETSLCSYFEKIMINVSISKEKISQFEKEDLIRTDVGRINISV